MTSRNDDGWKVVGKVRRTRRSIALELYLTCNLSAPCYVSMETLDKVMNGEYMDGSIYQKKEPSNAV